MVYEWTLMPYMHYIWRMIWNTFSCNALLFSIFNAKSNVLHFKPLVESSDLMPLISDVFSNLLLWRRKILKSSSQNCFHIYMIQIVEKNTKMFTKKVISRMIKGPILHIFGSKIILLFVKILSYMGSYRRQKKCAVDVMTWVVNKKVISRC